MLVTVFGVVCAVGAVVMESLPFVGEVASTLVLSTMAVISAGSNVIVSAVADVATPFFPCAVEDHLAVLLTLLGVVCTVGAVVMEASPSVGEITSTVVSSTIVGVSAGPNVVVSTAAVVATPFVV